METIKKAHAELPWKLVWDADTKDVLFLEQIQGEFETVNELFETDNKDDIFQKISELGLKYEPQIEEDWI